MIKVTAPVRIDISAGHPDSDPFRSSYGGGVLNGAINYRVSAELRGRMFKTDMGKVPSNSGLGTSGAVRAAFLVVFNEKLLNDKMELIKRVHTFENEVLDQHAGLQDQAAAIFGGVNYWDFSKNGEIKRKEIGRAKARHLQERIVLVYTGEKHSSADIHDFIFKKNYRKNVSRLRVLKSLTREMLANLINEGKMGELISETWEIEKSLSSGMETNLMRRLQKVGRGHYLGCRSTGAGGGGCMIFYTADKAMLIRKFNKEKSHLGNAGILPFDFDFSGLRIEKE